MLSTSVSLSLGCVLVSIKSSELSTLVSLLCSHLFSHSPSSALDTVVCIVWMFVHKTCIGFEFDGVECYNIPAVMHMSITIDNFNWMSLRFYGRKKQHLFAFCSADALHFSIEHKMNHHPYMCSIIVQYKCSIARKCITFHYKCTNETAHIEMLCWKILLDLIKQVKKF